MLRIEKKYPEARTYLSQGLLLAQEINNIDFIQSIYTYLSSLDSAEGKYDEALQHYRLSIIYRDSINNHENATQAIREQMQFEFDKKEALSAAEKEKQDALANEAFARKQDSLQFENTKRELYFQKELELKTVTYEYNKKQAAAKTEKERQQLRFEEELKQTQIQNKYEQKQQSAEIEFTNKQNILKTEQKNKDTIAKQEINKQKLIRNGLLCGLAVFCLFAIVFFKQRNRIIKEKNRSEQLLLNILPAEIAEELKTKGSADAKLIDEVTVIFTDFVEFTQLSEKLSPKELVGEINEIFSMFDNIMQKNGIEKIKTIGDAYMAAGGLPTANSTHAYDVVNAALEIQQYMQEHKVKKAAEGKAIFEIRIGIHSGPVVAGIVGIKKFAYDIWGDTVNTASRLESNGEAGKVNISGSTFALVKDKFTCKHRGKVNVKGKGEIDMYFVSNK